MPNDGSPSRRRFLRSAGIAAGLAAVPLVRTAHAQTKRQVTLRLDWIYQGPNSGFVVAQEKGFYDQVGLNVEVGPGKGSGNTAQLVADDIAIREPELRRLAGNELGDAIRVRGWLCRRQRRVEGDEYQGSRGTISSQSDRGRRPCQLRHQDAEGPRGQDHCHYGWIHPIPAVAGFRQGLRARCQQNSYRQYRSRRQSACADNGAGSCHCRLRIGPSPKRGNSRQHESACLLVCGLWRHRGQQLYRRSQRSDQRGSRTGPEFRRCQRQRIFVWAKESRRDDRHRQEVLARDRASHRASRGGNVMAKLDLAEHPRKAVRLDVGKGLGGNRRGAQAVRRRHRPSPSAAALYQRLRPHRRRVHPAAGGCGQKIKSNASSISSATNAKRPPAIGDESKRDSRHFFLGTTAQASISTSISFRSMPTPLSSVAFLGCCRKSGSNSSKKRYISSRMSKTSSRRGR